MANITLGSAVLDVNRKNILVTITGSPTAPLKPVSGYVTGFTATANGVSATLGIPVITGSSLVVKIPLTNVPAAGSKVILTATSSNLEDSTATPKTLSNGSLTVSDYQSPLAVALQAAFSSDPLTSRLTNGDFGQVVAAGGNLYQVYDHDNVSLLCEVEATSNNDGSLTFQKFHSVPAK